MATSSALATVVAGQTTPVKRSPIATESPGNWKHPRLAEITRRRGKTVFTEKNVKTIVYNIGALVLIWVLRLLVKPNVPPGL